MRVMIWPERRLAATRPTQEEKELVWFDRAPRTAHVYERTRVTKQTPQSLVDYLDKELGRFPDSLPAPREKAL